MRTLLKCPFFQEVFPHLPKGSVLYVSLIYCLLTSGIYCAYCYALTFKLHPTARITLETFDLEQDLWFIHFAYIPDVAICLSESESLLNRIKHN